MIHELTSNDFVTYEVKDRKIKDPYTARKAQKDRKKLVIWLEALLKDREVIIFFMDGEEERSIIATLKDYEELPSAPMNIEIINNKVKLQMHYIRCYEQPTRTPYVIHTDNITKFITRSEGVLEISRKTRFV